MFSDGDIICFLGDSITANGLVCAEVYQTVGKKKRIKCFNCGVSGGDANNAADYIYSHCLIRNPSYVVVNFGINDVGLSLYYPSCSLPDKMERRAAALARHKAAYERIVKTCLDFGVKVIVTIQSPYDDVSAYEQECSTAQEALDESAAFIRSLAEKYSLPVVDYGSVMRKDLSKGLICADRVHPTRLGYHYMAQIFMRDTGEIDECDFETPFEPEEWNRERLAAEGKLMSHDKAEYCILFRKSRAEHMTFEQRKAYAKEVLDGLPSTSCNLGLLADYTVNGDFREELVEAVVKRSPFIKE